MIYIKGTPTKVVIKNRQGVDYYRLGLLVIKQTEFGTAQEIIPLSLPTDLVEPYKVYANAVDDTDYLIPVEINVFNDKAYFKVVGLPEE